MAPPCWPPPATSPRWIKIYALPAASATHSARSGRFRWTTAGLSWTRGLHELWRVRCQMRTEGSLPRARAQQGAATGDSQTDRPSRRYDWRLMPRAPAAPAIGSGLDTVGHLSHSRYPPTTWTLACLLLGHAPLLTAGSLRADALHLLSLPACPNQSTAGRLPILGVGAYCENRECLTSHTIPGTMLWDRPAWTGTGGNSRAETKGEEYVPTRRERSFWPRSQEGAS
jgi:hypothetical protein